MRIESTEKTPMVEIDEESQEISIRGISIPEDSSSFYEPIMRKINEFTEANNKVTVNLFLDYFNTSSSKYIMLLLRNLETASQDGTNVRVNWSYQAQDEDMKEAGADYQHIVDFPFNFIEEKQSAVSQTNSH